MAVADIKNFALVGEQLATAGQPTEGQLHEIAAAGYQVVINLGLLDPKYCLADEAALVVGLGLRYHHLPVKFDQPQLAEFERFVALMDGAASMKTFVHCAANFRVSTFVALYGQLRRGWTAAEADRHLQRFWQPNEVWAAFAAEVREQLGLAPSQTPSQQQGPVQTS